MTWRRRAVYTPGDAVPPRSKNNQVGMIPAKSLRYVAVPANRRVSFKYVPELIQINLIPTQQLSIRAAESRPVVHPMKFWKGFSAISAIFVAVPSH
jgi:hypothetical protein